MARTCDYFRTEPDADEDALAARQQDELDACDAAQDSDEAAGQMWQMWRHHHLIRDNDEQTWRVNAEAAPARPALPDLRPRGAQLRPDPNDTFPF